MLYSGDDLEKMLERTMCTSAPCRKCGEMIVFQDGASAAMKLGIRANVVQCSKCNTIYKVDVTPRGMSLLDDVTSQYS